jgi:hypothetical protein
MTVEQMDDRRPRVGFLYNHEALHQVPHSAPMAASLAREWNSIRVEALATSQALADAFNAVTTRLGAPLVPIRLFLEPAWQRTVANVLDLALPFSRLANLRAHAETLAAYDALVVTETTSLFLKRWLGPRCPRLLWVSHGAGDRAIGFRKEMGKFDRLLVAGDKLRDRMIEERIASAERIDIVGYAKFDAVGLTRSPRPRLFDNAQPTVLYNPHFEPHLSSWWKMGEPVLDWFLAHPEYNLIFAPHVMLFKRKLALSVEHAAVRWRRDLPERFRMAPNIHVDVGSEALFDMSYTRAADIYLGDVSSQVYEFLVEPRPCIFLKAHDAQWQGNPNYAMWGFGPVVEDVAHLGEAIARAPFTHAQFVGRQRAMVAETFDRADMLAARRGAAAIARAVGA